MPDWPGGQIPPRNKIVIRRAEIPRSLSAVTTAFPEIVHSVTLDYAEYTRNFATGDPDAFVKFLLQRVPRSVRWQLWANADDPNGIERQMKLIRSTWH